jgi:hypothetical protein
MSSLRDFVDLVGTIYYYDVIPMGFIAHINHIIYKICIVV